MKNDKKEKKNKKENKSYQFWTLVDMNRKNSAVVNKW